MKKTLIKIFKPLLKSLVEWIFKNYRAHIINVMCSKKVSGKIPLSGEQYEWLITNNYDVFCQAIINLIETEL
jgi:hypothetical protein